VATSPLVAARDVGATGLLGRVSFAVGHLLDPIGL
jgi:hypothetical protein